MHVSVRTLYALRALTLMANSNSSSSPLHARDLAEKLDMSENYLNQILGTLREAKIVRSKKGPHGGFRLNRAPEEISLAEVITVLEGPTVLSTCTKPRFSDCEIIDECSTQSILSEVSEKIIEYLGEVTIDDIRSEERDLPPLRAP